MAFSRIVVFTVLVTLARAGPLHHRKETRQPACALQCPKDNNNKFDYQPGTVYQFSYDAKTTTKMNGASEDSANIHMTAMVEIEPLTKCDLVMRIKDASLQDSEDDQNSQAFKEAMMKQPLKFSFQDGRIDHVCAMDEEQPWTLNIKRGILSAFQNSMDSFDRNQNVTETDVVGSCVSEYKILDEGRRVKLLKKSKNLLGCTDREGYRLAVQSIGYNVPSFVKSLPLMKSEYKCTQTLDLDSNILQSSTCSEEHVFRPFSYGKNGAMTSSEQTLTFINKRKPGRPSNEHFSQRSTLLFHHEHNTPSKQEKEEKIEAKLQELCQKAVEDIRPEVPEMVNQLIEHMRQVDRDVLSRVYDKINQKTICAPKADRIKQYFHDAIPMVGTAASVGMIQDLISKKHVTGAEAEMWLLSLSFVHHPTKEMVAATMPLLDESDVSGNVLLAVSSLASSYCNVRPECGKDAEISALIRKLMVLTHDCNAQNGDIKRIVFALRALGNIGHSHEAVSHLSRCVTRRDVPEEIRIAAMDAFRRIPCDAVRSDLMGVFRDESEDSELRLNAYIALMKCPSQKVLSEVRQVLEKEKSNQVGSFVWSHLTNLMETSDPHMQDIRNIVQDEELKKEFNLDQRKFSRNYEGSFFLDSINTGAKVDSNVIFSQKSFIPRSANLNLTIDLFGQAINFLDFGGRVQGMETILENFFRPTATKEPKLKTQNPNNFDKKMDEFHASAYMRIFGNELRYWDEKTLIEFQSSLKRLMNMQTVSFSKTMVLLDSRMTIPTCIGLPLSLTMSSTGSMSLDAKASFQKSISLHFTPSASVQVTGEMSVDAHVSKAGLKMVTVAHTSTGAKLDIHNNKFDLQIPQKKMEIFNLKTDFYIVHRNSEKKQKMIVDNVKKHEICTGKLIKQVTGLTFCQNIKFPNASSHNEAPFFPFTGPVVYDLHMINEDAPNGYQIEAFSKQNPYSVTIDTPGSKENRLIALETSIKSKNQVEINFKAPWKNIQFEGVFINNGDLKKLGGKLFVAGRTDIAFSAQLGIKVMEDSLIYTPQLDITFFQNKMKYKGAIEIHPKKSFLIKMDADGFTDNQINLKVSGVNHNGSIGLTSKLTIGKKEYYFNGHLDKSVTKSEFKYSSFLKITIPNKDLIEMKSEINYISTKRLSLQCTLKKVFSKTIDLNVALVHYAGKLKSKLSILFAFKSPKVSCQIIGHIEMNKAMWVTSMTATYHLGNNYSDRLIFSANFKNTGTMKSTKLITNINLKSVRYPSFRFHVNGKLSKNDDLLETNGEIQYGRPINKAVNIFNFSAVAKKDLKPFSHVYNYAISVHHPGHKINYKVEANHVQSAKWPIKKFENKVMIQMAPGKVVQTLLSYNNAKVKGLPSHEGEIALSYPGRDMKMTDKLTQVNKNTYENHFTVQWKKGQQATVQSTYTKTGKDIHNIENTLRLPNKKEAKATGMLQATSGAYKTKLQFSADEGMISRQQINYMAEGGVTYTFNAKKISSDVTAEVMWAPNQKISSNLNFDYTKMNLFTSKIAFSTPFDAMKSFDGQAKYTWANRKYTSMMSVSWNKQNELKQDFSFAYPDFLLSYDASALRSGKKSEIALGMKYTDMSVNGNIKVSHGKTTIIDVILKHNNQKMGIESEMGLDFDILDASGKMKTSLKYDNQKGELMSNGEGKLNLPVQQLRQISGSYNLKHNNVLSSIDVSYSSSLKNYRNAKMMVEMKKNLPKMIKATINLTLNGNPMVNINGNYGKKKDNIDMKVDVTGPSGETNTASGNVNLSGDRKTANVEIKSKYVDFSVDGSFEYQSPRSVDGELKVTTNGKSVMINVNYKKEGTTHKVIGTLGLPDGRPLKMEASLDLQNNLVALKTMSPDFLELPKVDLAFSFNGNRKTVNVEIKSRYIDFSVDGSFEYQNLRSGNGDLKVTTNGKSVTMNVNYKKDSDFNVEWFLVFPDQKGIDGKFLLNRKDKIDTSFILNSKGFQSIKHIDIRFTQHSDSVSISTKGNMKILPHLEKIEFESTLSKRDNTRFDFELKTPLANVNQVKTIMSSRRDSTNSQIIESEFLVNRNTIIDMKIHYDMKNLKDISAFLQVKTPHRRFDSITFNFSHTGTLSDMKTSVNLTVGKEIQFDAKLQNSYIYSEFFLKTYVLNFVDREIHLSRHGNTINDLYTMFLYKDGGQERVKYHFSINQYHPSMNISVKYPGTFRLEHFMDLYMEDMTLSFISNLATERQIYKFFVSYQHLKNLILTANVPSFDHELRMTFVEKAIKISTNLIYDNQNYTSIISIDENYEKIEAEFHTPYSHNSVFFTRNGNLKNMNINASFVHNGLETFKLTFSNLDYYRQLKTLLTTPSQILSIDFFLNGITRNLNTGLVIQHNHKKYEMKTSIKENTHINFMLNSPEGKCVIHFTKDSHKVNGNISVLFAGKKYEITLKKEANIEISLILSNYFDMRIVHTNYDLKANLKVLPYLEECKLEARLFSQDDQSKLDIVLKTSLDGLKNIQTTISWKKNSIFNQNVTLESLLNDKKSINMKLIYRINSMKDLTGSFAVETSHDRFKDISVDLKYFRQNIRMDSFLKIKFGREIDFKSSIRNTDRMSEISLSVEPRDYDALEMLITRLGFQDDLTATFSGKIGGEERFSGKFFIQRHDNSFNTGINSSLGNFEFKSELDIEKASFDLRSRMELKQNEIYKIFATYEHVTKLHVEFSVPSYNGELKMAADENLSTLNSTLKLKLANILMFDAMFQNSRKVSKLSIDGQILDFDEWKSTFELKGDLNSMTANIITSIAKKEVNKIEANLKNFGRSINFKVSGPNTVNYELNVDVDTEAITFNIKSSFTLDGQHTYDMIATYEHLSKLHIKVSIPYYEDELLITFAGNLKAFNMQSKFSHNNQIFELILSNKQYYRQMDGILNTPYFQDTVSFKFNGELEQMNIVAQVMHNQEKFELTFSNSGYYQQIDAKLDTPYFQPTLQFSLTGNPQKFNVELKINFDGQIYEMKASNEEYFRKMNFLLETPQLNCNFRLTQNGGSFHVSYAKTKCELELTKGDNYEFVFRLTNPRFNLEREEIYEVVVTYEHLAKLYIKSSFPSYNDELLLTLNGDLKMFNALAKLIHNTNKYELIISNESYYRKMEAQLITPFFTEMASFIFNGDQETFNTQVKFMHNKDNENVNKPIFKIDLLSKFDAGFKRFYSVNEIDCCDNIYKLTINSDNYYEGMNLKLNTPSIQTKCLFKFVGDLKAFNLTTILLYNDLQYEFTVVNVDYYKNITAALSTPFSQQSAMFKLKGNWMDNIQLETSFTLKQNTYYFSVSNRGLFQELNTKLLTPFILINGSFTSGENLDKFKLTTHLSYVDKQYRLFVSSLDNYRNLEIKVKTPSFKSETSLKLERENKVFLVDVNCYYNDKQYRLFVGNVDDNSKMIVKFIIPSFETEASLTVDEIQERFTFTSQIIHNQKKYQLELFCIDFYRNSKFNILTPSTKMEASLNIHGHLSTFNVISRITLNGQHYGLNIANSEFYRKIWTKVTTPHFTNSFLFNLKGNLETFRAEATFDHNNTQYKMAASNKDYYQNININLSTTNINNSLSFHLNGDLKAFSMKAAFKFNNEQYELITSNQDYYRQISIKLTTPFSEDSASFSFNGNRGHFSSKIKVMYRNEHYEFVINGHSLELWATLKTPSIRETFIFSLKGKSGTFNLSMSFSHNNVDYKMSLSIVRYYQRINFELDSPLINSRVIFNFDKETKELKTRMSLTYVSQLYEVVFSNLGYYRNLDIQVTTPSFTNTSLSYNLKGNLKSFTLQTTFRHNMDQYKISISNKDYFRHMDGNISTPYQTDSFSFHLNGDLKTFDSKTTFEHNNDHYELIVSNRDYYQQISSHLKTPVSEDSFTFSFDGNLTKFTSKAHVLYNKKQYVLSVSSRGYYREIDTSLVSPFVNVSAMFSLEGHLESFQLLTKAAYNTDKYQIKISNKGYLKSVNAELTFPRFSTLESVQNMNKYQMKLFCNGFDHQLNLQMNENFINFTSRGNKKRFNAVFTFKYKGTIYDIMLTQNSYQHLEFQLNTPFQTCEFRFDLSKDYVTAIFQIVKSKHKVNVSNNQHSSDNNSQQEFSIMSTVYYKQNSIIGDVTASLNDMEFILNGHYKRFGHKKIIKAELKTPYFKDRLHVVTVGTIRKFNANMKLHHNNDAYEIIASNKNYYDALDFNFNFPGMKIKFQSEGNVHKCKVSTSLKMATDLYEVNLSNQNYFQNINLEISAPQTGKCSFDFAFQGNWKKFDVESKFSQRNNNYGVNISIDRKTGEYGLKLVAPQIKISGHFNGDLKSFSLNANAAFKKGKYEIIASTKNYFREISGKLTIPQFEEQSLSANIKIDEHSLAIVNPQMNINGHFNGDLKSFSFNISTAFKKEKYEIMASTKNYFREISITLTTPELGEQSLRAKINGQLSNFNGFIKIMSNNEIYRNDFSLENNEFKSRLSLPKSREEIHVKYLNSKGNTETFMKVLHNDQRYEINLTKSKALKSHVIIPHWGSMNVSMNGDLRNGHANIKMHFGKNVFENVAQIRFDGNRLNIDVKILYDILSRSGQFDIQVSNATYNKSLKSQIGVKIEDVEFYASFSLQKVSSQTSAVFTVNVTSIENSEMKLRLLSKGINKVDAILNLNTPWTKLSKIYYQHDINSEQYFIGKAYIEQKEFRLIGYSVHANFDRNYSFDFKCDYNNYKNKVVINGDLKFHGSVTTAVVKVDTSFEILKVLNFATKITNNTLSCILNFTQQKQQFGFKFALSKNNGIISLNTNVKTLQKNRYQFQASYKNDNQMMGISRAFNFKIVHPVRTVEGGYRLTNNQDLMHIAGNLTWCLATNQKAGFELMMLKGPLKSGKFRIITPRRTIELFGKVEVNGNHYSTVGHIMMDENNKAQKIDINADIMESKDKVDIDLTVKFPNQKKGMNLKTSVNFPKGDIIFTSNSEFSIDQDPEKTFKMSTKLMSETKGILEMYSMQMDAEHAHTGFATELIGRVRSNPRKYHVDMEMGYLDFKHQLQKFAIRGILNKFNRKVNLKMEIPSNTIELDESQHNNNVHIEPMMKNESDKENMEALFNPKFNVKDSPSIMHLINTDVIKEALLNQQNIDTQLTPQDTLKSTIRWHPHNFPKFNKLKIYGEQIREFGEAFGGVLQEEILGKLVLVRRSFEEELSPLSESIVAESDALFQDFGEMWQESKEMYQRNYFYLKSAIGTLSRLSKDLWSSFQHQVDSGKMIVDNIYKKMKTEVGKWIKVVEYKVLFTKMSNKIIDYVMDIRAKINRITERSQNITKELINQIRQNYYGEQVIDFLLTIYEAVNEQRVQAKEHVETLTSAIYSSHAKLNRHIASARRYPMVDAIMDVINEIYQQALWTYKYWDIKDNVLGLKNDLYKFGAEKINEIKDIVTDAGMSILIFNPKHGEIMVEIHFGAAKYTYNHFMSSVEEIQRIMNNLRNLMLNTDLTVWDIYYTMKPSTDLGDYIPPFKAEASLFAGQHITTFDGRHFNYKGNCSYLLARDFVDGNFTIVANFDSDRKAKTLKSLSITTAHNEQVEIFADNKVFFNGGKAKLPLQLTDATVTGQGNLIVLESKRGYKVMCDHEIQLYTVKISGWYFNKMSGLFGNFNHEPVDDMLMSNSKYTNDLEQFAQSWSVSQQCKSHRNTAPSHMVPESTECAQFFLQTDSPFRYCFRQINPDYFYKTCATQMSSKLFTSRDLCKVTSFYIKECEKRKVFLRRPAVCKVSSDNVGKRILST